MTDKYLFSPEIKNWLYSTFTINKSGNSIAEDLLNLKAVIFFDYDDKVIDDVPLDKFCNNLDKYIEHYSNQVINKIDIVMCTVYQAKVLIIKFFGQTAYEDIEALNL